MSEKNDISNSDDPENFYGIDKLKELGSSRGIFPEELAGMSELMKSTLPNAIDPNEFTGLNKELFEALSKPSELAEFMKNTNMPVNDYLIPNFSEFNIPFVESFQELSFKEQKNFFDQSLKLQEQIKNNTSTLSTIVELIANNNDKQEEIIKLFTQMFAIAAAKNQEDLTHRFEKVLESIKNALELGEITGKLIYAAYTIFSIVSPIIGK
jgi:hypothetical protein